MKQHLIDKSQAAKVCLELAGGGYTVQQTAKAMEWQRTLLETGELKTRKFHLKLKVNPCGGCGESNPDKRCLGCLHPF